MEDMIIGPGLLLYRTQPSLPRIGFPTKEKLDSELETDYVYLWADGHQAAWSGLWPENALVIINEHRQFVRYLLAPDFKKAALARAEGHIFWAPTGVVEYYVANDGAVRWR